MFCINCIISLVSNVSPQEAETGRQNSRGATRKTVKIEERIKEMRRNECEMVKIATPSPLLRYVTAVT